MVKRIDTLTKNWRSEQSLRIQAERELAELRDRLNGGNGRTSRENPRFESRIQEESASPAFETETQAQEDGRASSETETPIVSKPVRPGASERYDAGVRKYGDEFRSAIAAADRAGVRISDRAITAIEAMRNSEDIVFYLATHPEECSELLTEADSATNKVGHISRHLMEHPEAIPQALRPQQQPQQPQLDPETARQIEKFHGHFKRTEALLATRPDAAKLIANAQASGVGISNAVNVALVEQENGEHVLLHLLEKPELREELNQLSYPAAMAKITKLAAQLESKSESKRVRPPDPISPIGNSSTRMGNSLETMDIHSFMRERNRQERERKRLGR